MTSASPQPGALEPARWSWARARAFCRLSRGRFKTSETSSPVGLARAIPRGFGTRYALGWVVSAPRASQRTLCTGGRALGESGPALESEGAKSATQFDEEPRDLRRGDRTDHSLRIISDDERDIHSWFSLSFCVAPSRFLPTPRTTPWPPLKYPPRRHPSARPRPSSGPPAPPSPRGSRQPPPETDPPHPPPARKSST